MASFRDLELDWSALCQDCTDCWTGEDLQLAAELGKTLLERNKELETALKQHQNVIEDQAQEIEYLTKQTVALREVSDSRLRIYEQLEVSIQDLERANHRLVLDNASGKKHIKTLTQTIEGLECKCEELQTTIDDCKLQIDVLKRRPQRHPAEEVAAKRQSIVFATHQDNLDVQEIVEPVHVTLQNVKPNEITCSTPKKKTETPEERCRFVKEAEEVDENTEQMSQLMAQLRESKSQMSKDQRRIVELEEQLAGVVQQNQALENQVIQLHHKDEDMKSMYDELSTLEEVRKGQMCNRCLRNVDDVPESEDNTSSIMEELMTPPQHRTSFHLNIQENHASPKETGNLYKDLVEKYEALLEVHRKPMVRASKTDSEASKSGDFHRKDTDEESGNGDSLKPKIRATFSHTPTDFSEAETSSSGFADETSNKATQTEERPGAFLCTIADGDDCKVSIYDDASPISSRFHNQPEYKELFKEIFTVLKTTDPAIIELPSKPEEKTAYERNLREEIDDDCQSVVSSTMSEMSLSQEPTTIIESIIQSQNEPIPDADPQSERVLRPLVRQPLEYLSVEVRKRSSSRRKNKLAQQRSDSPITHIIGSPKISYTSRPNSGKKKRDAKSSQSQENEPNWNGNSVQFWGPNNRNTASPTPSQSSVSRFEFKPSLASQELNKLKKLDLSYAEVVRKADNKKLASRQRRK